MRGEKMTELLKQPQYQPQAMEDQVAIIYAATNGFVNDIPTARLQNWAAAFIEFLHEKHPEIPKAIAEQRSAFGRRQEAARRRADRVQQERSRAYAVAYEISAIASGR